MEAVNQCKQLVVKLMPNNFMQLEVTEQQSDVAFKTVPFSSALQAANCNIHATRIKSIRSVHLTLFDHKE